MRAPIALTLLLLVIAISGREAEATEACTASCAAMDCRGFSRRSMTCANGTVYDIHYCYNPRDFVCPNARLKGSLILRITGISPDELFPYYLLLQRAVKFAYNAFCLAYENYKICCPGALSWSKPNSGLWSYTAIESEASEVAVVAVRGDIGYSIVSVSISPNRRSVLCNAVSYATTAATDTTTISTTTSTTIITTTTTTSAVTTATEPSSTSTTVAPTSASADPTTSSMTSPPSTSPVSTQSPPPSTSPVSTQSPPPSTSPVSTQSPPPSTSPVSTQSPPPPTWPEAMSSESPPPPMSSESPPPPMSSESPPPPMSSESPPMSSESEDPESSSTYPPMSSEPEVPESSSTYPPMSSEPEVPESSSTYPPMSSEPEDPESSSTYPPMSSEPEVPESSSTYPPMSSEPEVPESSSTPLPSSTPPSEADTTTNAGRRRRAVAFADEDELSVLDEMVPRRFRRSAAPTIVLSDAAISAVVGSANISVYIKGELESVNYTVSIAVSYFSTRSSGAAGTAIPAGILSLLLLAAAAASSFGFLWLG